MWKTAFILSHIIKNQTSFFWLFYLNKKQYWKEDMTAFIH